MADDQVKYSDLIAQDVQPGLTMLAEALKAVAEQIASLKIEATALKGAMSAAGTATREQQQATAQQAASVEGLSKKVKQLTEEERRLEDVRKRYKKLTDEQIERVNAFQQALRGSTQQQMAAVNAIEVETKSYNELNAMYNALKDSLNAMTVAERQNTEAGKAMTMQSAKIYDTMNELQKATGKYTLQVGKYRAAFDGLGFSFMQIAREAPSALNLNQFFLAISNNLPMFFDQIDRFKTEQKEIKQTLADLAAQGKQTSDEYIKIANQQTTVFKRLTQAIFSMQGAVLVFTMLLRFLPKIVDWFKKVFNSTNDLSNGMRTLKSVVLDIDKAVINAENDTVAALSMINERLKDLKPGTDDYVTAVRMVNDLTRSTLDEIKATPAEVQKVTAAYIDMQRKLAENAELQRLISRSNAGKAIRDIVMDRNAGSAADRAAMIGGENQGRIQELLEYFEKYKPIEEMNLWDFIKANIGFGGSFNGGMLGKATELDRLINQSLGILDEDVEKRIRQRFNIIANERKEDGPKKVKEPKEPNEQDLTDRYWDAEEALLKAQQEGYDLERALAKLNRDKQRDELINWYVDQRLALDENLKNGFITQEQYGNAILELDRQNKALQIGITNQYNAEIAKINKKQADEELKAKKAQEEAAEKAAKDGAKAELKAAVDGWAQYKAKLVEEGETRKQIVEAEVAAEIARLNLMLKLNRDVNGEIMSDEQKAKVQEWINLLEKLQQTGNYGDYKPGQFIGKGGANVGTAKAHTWSNIMDVLTVDSQGKDKSWVRKMMGGAFDTDMISRWKSGVQEAFSQAKAALQSWMDSLKAAADQKKELADDEVAAAENALNREIELRNQGYANDVALREKELADAKKKQQQALEEQKKVAMEQQSIDAAMQASSLITASANILKEMSKMGVAGLVASIGALALLWGAFGFAQYKAFEVTSKRTQFRDGVVMLNGGSHESGHDVNLGIGPDGSNLRAEGGEYFAVINKRSSRKYGSQIPAVVNALNSGMFEDRYIKTSDAVGLLPQVIRADNGSYVDLSKVEGGVSELVKQGEQNWTIEGDYRVLRYKNLTRRVKIG